MASLHTLPEGRSAALGSLHQLAESPPELAGAAPVGSLAALLLALTG